MKPSTAIICGAGIGGLAAATALGAADRTVTVLERTPHFGDVGAGLQISPNGLAVLRAMGLEPALRAHGAVVGRAVVLKNERGREVARLDLARVRPEQKYYFMHRADLIDVLAESARQAGATVVFGAEVSSIGTGAQPQVRLTTGENHSAGLVVAADGLHSVVRSLLNAPDAARFSGQVAWRALVENRFDHPPEVHVAMGPGRHIVSYPIRGGRLVNLVAVEERHAWAAEGWDHAEDPAALRAAFACFTDRAGEMVAAADNVTLWGLHLHPVARCWQKENVVLLGDAAHPTLPFLAQGANMALEDAWVLGQAVRRNRLDDYQARREARVTRVIRTAERNAWRYHVRPGPVRALGHFGLGLASRFAPGRMVGAFDWLYGEDVTRA